MKKENTYTQSDSEQVSGRLAATCSADLLITEYELECKGFTRTFESEDMWWRDGVRVWEFNDKGWLVDALDQAGITVYFKTLGELDTFWRGCQLPPLLPNK